jgi:hypothetical protein
MAVKPRTPPHTPPTPVHVDPTIWALLLLTVVMIALRLYAAQTVGLGDSEALYVCYALHPQAAYLDHPGLVGVLASSLGSGTAPTALVVHTTTAMLASTFPWLVLIVARRMGAATRPAAIAGLVVAVTPEIGIGLFALTPDLLLAWLWLGFLGVAALALAAEPKSVRAAALFPIAGAIAGVAATAKVTGVLLLPALALTVLGDRRHRRTVWPWVGLLVGLVPIVPVVRFEAARGFPMLHHRFVDTQAGAGASLRNLGALVGGQLLYLSPVIAVIAVVVARDLVRNRREDATSRLLFWTFLLPLAPLVVLCVWSRVAEPHWLAPPLLALPLFAARRAFQLSRKWVSVAIATGLVMVLAVYAWILTPSLLRFAPASYDAKVDIANELFGWPQASRSVGELVEDTEALAGTRLDTWIIGPSWMVCAQLQANAPLAHVGCATQIPTDFDDWASRARWEHADAVIFVTDDRMPMDPVTVIPSFHTERTERVTILRGGHIARTFRLTVLLRRVGA